MPAPIVFFDIAGPDAPAQSAFYRSAFGWEVGPGGQVSAAIPGGGVLSGVLRTDPADKVIYFGVEDINRTLEMITAVGGAVDTPRFIVPGVVILALFRDPAGNRLGLVETRDGVPIVP